MGDGGESERLDAPVPTLSIQGTGAALDGELRTRQATAQLLLTLGEKVSTAEAAPEPSQRLRIFGEAEQTLRLRLETAMSPRMPAYRFFDDCLRDAGLTREDIARYVVDGTFESNYGSPGQRAWTQEYLRLDEIERAAGISWEKALAARNAPRKPVGMGLG